jgi:hypothetical protein
MLYYVQSGEVETSVRASSHRQAAVKALKSCGKDLGTCVMVNDREMSEEDYDGVVFFLTRNILDDCFMKIVS